MPEPEQPEAKAKFCHKCLLRFFFASGDWFCNNQCRAKKTPD